MLSTHLGFWSLCPHSMPCHFASQTHLGKVYTKANPLTSRFVVIISTFLQSKSYEDLCCQPRTPPHYPSCGGTTAVKTDVAFSSGLKYENIDKVSPLVHRPDPTTVDAFKENATYTLSHAIYSIDDTELGFYGTVAVTSDGSPGASACIATYQGQDCTR